MRALVVLALVVMGCSPRPCSDTCGGCCDADEVCRAGTSDSACGNSGNSCARCVGTLCSPTGVCAVSPAGGGGVVAGGGGGGGGAMGGGSATGGGSASQVFVSLQFATATCCDGCDCRQCRMEQCQVTRSVAPADFAAMRSGDFSACVVTSTGQNSYSVDCRRCTTSSPMCGTAQMPIQDTVITCPPAPRGATFFPCAWSP